MQSEIESPELSLSNVQWQGLGQLDSTATALPASGDYIFKI